jgi:hypothetical protein
VGARPAARRLEEKVVAGRRRLFGDEDSETLRAIGKLAVTMAAQGEPTAARRLQEAVVDGMRARHGDRRPRYLARGQQPGRHHSGAGDLAAARALLDEVVETLCRAFGEEDTNATAFRPDVLKTGLNDQRR